MIILRKAWGKSFVVVEDSLLLLRLTAPLLVAVRPRLKGSIQTVIIWEFTNRLDFEIVFCVKQETVAVWIMSVWTSNPCQPLSVRPETNLSDAL